jgi:hypothetical protein
LQVYQSDQSACALLPQISFLSSVFDSLFLWAGWKDWHQRPAHCLLPLPGSIW